MSDNRWAAFTTAEIEHLARVLTLPVGDDPYLIPEEADHINTALRVELLDEFAARKTEADAAARSAIDMVTKLARKLLADPENQEQS